LNTKDKRISAFTAIAISKFENPMSKEYLVITKVPYYRRYIFSENVEKLIEKKMELQRKIFYFYSFVNLKELLSEKLF
jgi:hypothetical protein